MATARRTARERSEPTQRELAEMEMCRVYTNEELAELCPGLSLILDFVSEEQELALANELDSLPWDDRLSRRVQHYGYEFDYHTRLAANSTSNGGMTNSSHFPPMCQSMVVDRLPQSANPDKTTATTTDDDDYYNQLTVNEYLPGRGIAAHVDSHSCFGECMLSLSLLSNTCIRFTPKSSALAEIAPGATSKVNLWLPRRALLVMRGPSRYAFTHGIASRKSDWVLENSTTSSAATIVPRVHRRVSLTFRSVVNNVGCACAFPDTCEAQRLKMKPPRLAPRQAPSPVAAAAATTTTMEDAQIYSNEELAELCPGLSLIQNFISEEEELALCAELDAQPWDERLSRRVQHYGFEFDYATRMAAVVVATDDDNKQQRGWTNSTAFPPLCQSVVLDRLSGGGGGAVPDVRFDQLTVNEYLPGQGIAPHVDSHSCFEDCMLSVSLMANICIRFVQKSVHLAATPATRINLWLPRRSLLVMRGPARLAFSHCVPARKSDLVRGVIVPREERRVSLTFRTVRSPVWCKCAFPDACEVQGLKLAETRIPARPAPSSSST